MEAAALRMGMNHECFKYGNLERKYRKRFYTYFKVVK